MLSQSTLLHNMRNTADLDNKLISKAISGLRTRLPSNWRMEVEAQPASSVGVPDVLLRLCAAEGTCGHFILEAKNRVEPKDVSTIADQMTAYSRLGDVEGAVPL